MADSSAVLQKKKEVQDLARKYGVEDYIGTQRLEMADAYIQMWAKDSKSLDSLAANSLWLDTKGEIEDMMASLSLEQNSKSSLYLLGASATGQVNFDEVRQAYVDGWNTLMQQYGNVISSMNQVAMTDLERKRDRFMAQLPAFGLADEKVKYSLLASNDLRAIEGELQQLVANTKVNEGKMELAKRETTRTMILSEAESGFKSGRLPQQVYQEIKTLIGRGNSLFNGQVKSIPMFKTDPDALFQEMDRVLSKASLLLKTQENAFSLAGISKKHDPSYKQYSKVAGSTGMTGDGIRVVKTQNMIYNTVPKKHGELVSHFSNPPQVFPNSNQVPPEATVVPANLSVWNQKPSFTNPSSVYRDQGMLTQFDQYRQGVFGSKAKQSPLNQHRNAGLMGTGLGESKGESKGALEYLSSSKIVQIASVLTAGYVVGKAVTSKMRMKPSNPLPSADPFNPSQF